MGHSSSSPYKFNVSILFYFTYLFHHICVCTCIDVHATAKFGMDMRGVSSFRHVGLNLSLRDWLLSSEPSTALVSALEGMLGG